MNQIKLTVRVLIALFFVCCGVRPALANDDIHTAAWAGNLEKLAALLDHDPTLIRSRNSEQETPLHRAADAGQAAAAELLLKRGAEVNSQAYNQFTPLHLAANAQVAKVLIKGGANLGLIDAWGKTPLQMAIQERKLDVVDAILGSGQKLDLLSAVMLDKRDAVVEILAKEPHALADLNGGSDLWGNVTPLGIVAGRGDKEMVELFLKSGAEVNSGTFMPNAGGNATPLCNAVWGNHPDIVQLLFDHGASWQGAGGKFYDSIFHYAVQNSDPKIVDLFLKHGATLETKWPTGVPRTSLLSVAAQAGSVEKVKLILDHAPNAFTDQEKQIAMLDAAEADHFEVVKFFRDQGVLYDIVTATIVGDAEQVHEFVTKDQKLVNAKDDRFGRPVLSWAIKHRRHDIAFQLIDRGADANARTVREQFYGETLHFGPVGPDEKLKPLSVGETPLVLAIQIGEQELVRRLLDASADINARDWEGNTPLHAAVDNSNLTAVKLLISHGADVNAKNSRASTPLHESYRSGEIARVLVEAGADVNAVNEFNATPLDWAVGWKDSGAMQVLLDHGAKLTFPVACIVGNTEFVKSAIEADPALVDKPLGDDPTETSLVRAAMNGQVDIVRILLEHGATVNFKDGRRTTPLHAAAEGGSAEVTQMLLDHGADITASNYQGTALHRAAMYGRLEVVKLFIERGANVNEEADGGGWTPLHAVASWSDSAEVAEYLIAHGADVNHRLLRGGETPLNSTTMQGGVNVARVLLAHGANVNNKDNRGETPLTQALRHNLYEDEDATIKSKRAQLVELLKSHGGVE